MKNYVLKNEILTVTICDLGAEVISIVNKDGKEVIHQGCEVYRQHCPICFPVIGNFHDDIYSVDGKDYKLMIHGFAKISLFAVTIISDTEISFKISSTPETLKIYPFEFDFTVNYKLFGNDLVTEYVIENRGDGTMYYGVGTHTGYKLENGLSGYIVRFENAEDDSKLELFPKKYILPLDEVIKNGIIELDDHMFARGCFTLKNISAKRVVLEDKDGNGIVKIDFSEFDYITFWSAPGQKYICIEPWSYESGHYSGHNILNMQRDITALASGEVKKHSHVCTIL